MNSTLVKTCGGCGKPKPLEDFHCNKVKPDGRQTQCKLCMNERNAKYAQEHPERVKANSKKHYAQNSELVNARSKVWHENNPDAVKESGRKSAAKRRASNPMLSVESNRKNRALHIEERRAYDRKRYLADKDSRNLYVRNWRLVNKGVLNHYSKRRKAATIQAVPSWIDSDAVREFYRTAKQMSEKTGESWHVDHIVPLRSRLVCGLHVQQNLRVIHWRENLSKSNRHWPDMP